MWYLHTEENGESVKDFISTHSGREMVDYIDKVLEDMNGSIFRTSAFNGLLIE